MLVEVAAFVLGVLVMLWMRRPPKVVTGLFALGIGDLKMQFVVPKTKASLGAISAECCKACVAIYQQVHGSPVCQRWESVGWRKIVLKCDDANELVALQRSAQRSGVPTLLRRSPNTDLQVLCLGPAPDSQLSPVTGSLKLL